MHFYISVLLARFFIVSFILGSKLIFVNLTNSRVLVELVVSDILVFIPLAFLLRAALVDRLLISGTLF